MDSEFAVVDGTIRFDDELLIGTIVRRPNRFIIEVEVEIEGGVVSCHCPTTGRIGNLVLDGLRCLLSPSSNPRRKTPYTVEAISVDPVSVPDSEASWIGINQNAANRFVELALAGHLLTDIIAPTTIAREQKLGESRLDFLVDDTTYIEVKTPLQTLQVSLGAHIQTRKVAPFDSTDRFVRHIAELGRSLATQQRAVLIVCFLYDNPGFVVEGSSRHEDVRVQVAEALARGVEIWQVNFGIAPDGVRVLGSTDISAQFA